MGQSAGPAVFLLHIAVTNVNELQIHLMNSGIFRYLLPCASYLLIARDVKDPNNYGLMCAIESNTPHETVAQDLRSRVIPGCLGNDGMHAVMVAPDPRQDGEQVFDECRKLFLLRRWRMTFDGPAGSYTGPAAAASKKKSATTGPRLPHRLFRRSVYDSDIKFISEIYLASRVTMCAAIALQAQHGLPVPPGAVRRSLEGPPVPRLTVGRPRLLPPMP